MTNQLANGILKSMGYSDEAIAANADIVKDDLERDLDDNHEFYEKMRYVDKPNFVIREENAKEAYRRGAIIDEANWTPLKDMVIIKMEPDRKDFKIEIADLRPVKMDSNIGYIVNINPESKYDFNIGDKVVFNPSKSKYRYFMDKHTHIIIDKKEVIAVF
jgi:co-chaperonin GroES (HSP10)